MRGPVGSLERAQADVEAFDAGSGVIVYVERALLGGERDGSIVFQFGLLGSCTAIIEPIVP